MSLNVLMFGWELPPYNSGGLGEACFGLTKALANQGVYVNFVLPEEKKYDLDYMNLMFANVDFARVRFIHSYETKKSWDKVLKLKKDLKHKHNDYVSAAYEYALGVSKLLKNVDANVIHAHDWLSFLAGLNAKRSLELPMISHVHATEYDRSGGNYPNSEVASIEEAGVNLADRIVPVSNLTKNILIDKYHAPEEKIRVIHNGLDSDREKYDAKALTEMKALGYKFVLFLGRITLQKGPDYFVRAAQIVSKYEPKAVFVVTGSGDMYGDMISQVASVGLSDRFIFTGFLRDPEKKHALYSASDVYVMPSVSEPFGITSLEAIDANTPVVMSKQSGSSEVLKNVLKVDFWDVEEMANKILAALNYNALKKDMVTLSKKELDHITWDNAAKKCIKVYEEVV